MGDRGNIQIKTKEGSVFFYTHWRGSELKPTLAAALARGKERWGDDQYLARIIFCEMIRGEELDELTGFGIGATQGDNEHPILVVDMDEQTVCEVPDSGKEWIKLNRGDIKTPIPFVEFVDKYAVTA